MPEVYLHLSGRDVDRKLLEHRGLLKEEETLKAEEQPLKPIKCPRCGLVNPADAKFCSRCSMALSLKAVVDIEAKRGKVRDLLNALFQDPEMREFTEKKMRELRKEGKI